MKKINNLFCITLCTFSLFLTACTIKQVDYQEFPLMATKKEMVEAIGSEPNKETKEEDGGTTYEYSKSRYEDYIGKMKYYYADDSLVYSKWEYLAKNEEKMQKAYRNICSKMSTDYGKGTASEDNTSTTFTSENKFIIVAYSTTDGKYMVGITDMMK